MFSADSDFLPLAQRFYERVKSYTVRCFPISHVSPTRASKQHLG